MDTEYIEGLLMRYADEELTKSERVEVETLLATRPELRKELEEITSVKVTAPVAVMPGKERLLRKAAVIPLWGRVAAAVIVLVAATIMLLPGAEPIENMSAQNNAPVLIIPDEPSPCPAIEKTTVRPATLHRHKTALVDNTEPLVAVADSHPQPIDEPVVTSKPIYPLAQYVETDQLAVVKETPTVATATIVDVQLTSTPMQTIVRELLALKEN